MLSEESKLYDLSVVVTRFSNIMFDLYQLYWKFCLTEFPVCLRRILGLNKVKFKLLVYLPIEDKLDAETRSKLSQRWVLMSGFGSKLWFTVYIGYPFAAMFEMMLNVRLFFRKINV